jgi:hypothetical protein
MNLFDGLLIFLCHYNIYMVCVWTTNSFSSKSIGIPTTVYTQVENISPRFLKINRSHRTSIYYIYIL